VNLDPIHQLNLVTIVGVIVLFVITLLVLRRTFFRPLLGVMLERDAKIEQGRQIREEAERLVADAQLEADRIWTDSATRQEQRIAAIKAEIASSREARIAQGTAKAEGILASGREEVERLKESEHAEMRDSLATSVVETLSTLIGTVDERAVRALVDKQLAENAAEEPVT